MRALTAAVALLLVLAAPAAARRPFPDTRDRVHVFNDQLATGMTPAQERFVARHEDGTQKITAAAVARLRRYNPGFLVLHYRLGLGASTVPFLICNRWRTDLPAVERHPGWFARRGGRRVRQRQWAWWLMDPDSGWRAYWARQVLREVRCNHSDGVFADSLSVPHYLGAESFDPPFEYFSGEAAWTRRVNRFMRYEQRRLRGRVWFVPNAGSMITTRDRTDYAIPDGVMVEGFAEGGPDAGYAPVDWRLQMDRVLRLVRRGRIVIGQSYLGPGDLTARGFVLGAYLLVKGRHTFVNMDTGLAPEWFPEYDVRLGRALAPPPRRVAALRRAGGAYVRRFARGEAVVNPGSVPVTYRFGGARLLVVPRGGGPLPAGGRPRAWRLTTRPAAGSLRIGPREGAVLLYAAP
jgi:hypothetical protein